MSHLKNFFRRIFRGEEGQTLSEYALILVLVAIVVIIALTALGVNITAILQSIANTLGGAI
ncbi:Flp family type IVb pilin [candidate division KSB1 bacterium]|nr:Flp family type IVb pilin [candidate division KSB1 bacterium]